MKAFVITTKETLDDDDKVALFSSWLVVRDKIDANVGFAEWLKTLGFTAYYSCQSINKIGGE